MKYFGRIVAILLALLPLVAFSAVDVPENEYVVFYAQDVLGSPVAVSDDQGRVLWYENSQPYGKSLGRKNFSGDGFRDNASEEVVSRVGYSGHQADSATGLVYMKARYYDPQIGRFYSNDPAGLESGSPMLFNRYSYANNNPYKYIDPDGKKVDLSNLSQNSRTRDAYNNLKYMDVSAGVIADLEASDTTYYISNASVPVTIQLAASLQGAGVSKEAAATDKGIDLKPTIYIEEGIEFSMNVVGQDTPVLMTHEGVLFHELGHLHLYDRTNGKRGFRGRGSQSEQEIWTEFDDAYNMNERASGGEFVHPESNGSLGDLWSSVKSLFGGSGDD